MTLPVRSGLRHRRGRSLWRLVQGAGAGVALASCLVLPACQSDSAMHAPANAPTVHAGEAAAQPLVLRGEPPRPDAAASSGQGESATAGRHLIEAAACLEEGKEAQAILHLHKYLVHRPQQILMRAELAELLFRQKQLDESRRQFEQFVSQAQEKTEENFRYLVHSHSRLVEIAELQENGYQENLNRGIGLYLLACRSAEEPDDPQRPELSAEALFCRAATHLQAARKTSPHASRPHWYLHQVWTRLGQTAAARRALEAADAGALTSPLTPCEVRALQLAALRASDPR